MKGKGLTFSKTGVILKIDEGSACPTSELITIVIGSDISALLIFLKGFWTDGYFNAKT